MLDETALHILGGGIGGTVGAVLTCPLEVLKVRFQSSQGLKLQSSPGRDTEAPTRSIVSPGRHSLAPFVSHARQQTAFPFSNVSRLTELDAAAATRLRQCDHLHIELTPCRIKEDDLRKPRFRFKFPRSTVIRCLTDIAKNEGFGALFKGLIPTLVGVLPSRGIYFCAYHKGQLFFERHFPSGSSGVFLCAAAFGSITTSTLTNPIWFVKTRLQLDSSLGGTRITVSRLIRDTWKRDGLRGFYRGVSASYVGSVETGLNYMLYEYLKAELLFWDRQRRREFTGTDVTSNTSVGSDEAVQCSSELRGSTGGSKLSNSSDMGLCMLASGFSKASSITLTYPHEVIRTRLREESGRYRGFLSTLSTIFKEEGMSGLYRGMGTHYLRQVPNSCIMIGTYEVVIFLLQSWGFSKQL